MRLLILGGTAFLGRVLARQAVDSGVEVISLARGSAPAGARLVRADRDDDGALATVAREEWDVIIDLTHQPGHARHAVRDLRADHWVLVSSGNVYARFDRPEQAEDAERLPPLDGEIGVMAGSSTTPWPHRTCSRTTRPRRSPVTSSALCAATCGQLRPSTALAADLDRSRDFGQGRARTCRNPAVRSVCLKS